MIGTKLAHYQVTAHLGSGGMGDVYQATDLKLGRSVAIKLLPEAFTHDIDRAARFEREARVLASLNHPNIAAIYGIEEAGGRKFLVMELVPGETLAERIKRGPLPVHEALTIAKEITEGLESAHEKGIIHRDLKPANVKITPDGKVKVLDFGLAKAYEPETSNASLSNSPTMATIAATNAGVILGTAAYMSPEQAKGFSADTRSDVFSFGCVLFEILTGKQPFDGETVSEILASVLVREPDFTLLPGNLNPRLHELLHRCLDKNPKGRWHAVADLRIELATVASDVYRRLDVAQPLAAGRRTNKWLVRALVSVLALISLVAVILGVFVLRPVAPPPETRVEINTPATSQPLHFAISSDGRQLVFVASGDGSQRLWLRPLDAAAARPLAGTEGAEYPFWSPDSRSVGFFASGKLKRVDIGGGSPQPVTDAPLGRGGAWNRDGTILFAPSSAGPLWRVLASGGPPVQVTKLDLPRQGSHRLPQFLPDGRHFLFFSQGNAEGRGIYLGSLDASDTNRLTDADTAGTYVKPGLLVFIQQGVLVARRLDVAQAALEGNPMTLADSVSYDTSFNLGAFSVSPDGDVAYRTGGSERRQLTWFDRMGKAAGVVGEPDVNGLLYPELSPDGRRVAVVRRQGNFDIWLMDVLRGSATRSTFDASVDNYPAWSPDGTRIAFTSNREGGFDLYTKQSNGAGADELLWKSPHTKQIMDWSPDGRFVLYTDADPKTGYDLWALPMTGDRKPVLVINTPFEERCGQFSPDSRWVAYQSNESGRFEIYVQPFPGAGGKWQVSTAGGTDPRWRRDGKELFFTSPDAKLMAAHVQASGATFEAASSVALFQTRVAAGGDAYFRQQYDVSQDGRFLINTVTEASTIPISLLLNWHPEPGK